MLSHVAFNTNNREAAEAFASVLNAWGIPSHIALVVGFPNNTHTVSVASRDFRESQRILNSGRYGVLSVAGKA